MKTIIINDVKIVLTKRELLDIQTVLDKGQKDGTIGYELKVELMQALTAEAKV